MVGRNLFIDSDGQAAIVAQEEVNVALWNVATDSRSDHAELAAFSE